MFYKLVFVATIIVLGLLNQEPQSVFNASSRGLQMLLLVYCFTGSDQNGTWPIL